MSDAGPPPPPLPPPLGGAGSGRPADWARSPDNPTTYPGRHPSRVDADVERARTQQSGLEAEMRRTGQTDALVVAPLERVSLVDSRACTSTTWTSAHITVLPRADVLVLVELPTSVDGSVRQMTVRWDVVARVCGASCWQPVARLDPPRWITRRWPTPSELEVLAALALPTI